MEISRIFDESVVVNLRFEDNNRFFPGRHCLFNIPRCRKSKEKEKKRNVMLPAIGRRQRRSMTNNTMAQYSPDAGTRTRPRGNSVDLDLQDLNLIRVTIQKDMQAKFDIIALEHAKRQELDGDEEAHVKQITAAMKKSYLYARYQDVQREQRKHQENATRRIHELFDQCRAQERAEQLAAEEEKILNRQRKTQKFKQSLQSNLQEHWRETEVHKSQLHEYVQRQREEAHRRRVLAENDKLTHRHAQVTLSRQEQEHRSRQRVSDKALERGEKRRQIQAMRAESCSPTMFMALPPMKTLLRRGTFAETVEKCMEGGGDYRTSGFASGGTRSALSSFERSAAVDFSEGCSDPVMTSSRHRAVGIATEDF